MVERARVTPLSKGCTGLQTTVDDETLALLEEYRALVSHAVAANDLVSALRALTKHLGKREDFTRPDAPKSAAA